MAIYTTTTKVKREAGFQNNSNVNDSLDVTPHLNQAEGEINGVIGKRYTLPMSGNATWTGSLGESLIIELATKLAAGLMILQMFEGQGDQMTKTGQQKIKDVREILEKIASGEIQLLDTASAELATNDSALNTLSGYPDNTADEDQTTANPRKFTMQKSF